MSLVDLDWYLNKSQIFVNKKESRIKRDASMIKSRYELPEDLRDLFDQLHASDDE